MDYEHWFYSMKKLYNALPAVDRWIIELQTKYRIDEMMFFADFSDIEIYREVDKLRRVTNYIIDTSCSPKEKDDTDFIILDFIYRKAAAAGKRDAFVIMTGDGHFAYAIRYLVQSGHETAVYGVKAATSRLLKEQATWYVELDGEEIVEQYFPYIMEYMWNLEHGYRRIQATFLKTAEMIAEKYTLDIDVVKQAIAVLKAKGCIYDKSERSMNHGKMISAMYVDWQSAEREGLLPDKPNHAAAARGTVR